MITLKTDLPNLKLTGLPRGILKIAAPENMTKILEKDACDGFSF